MLNVIHHLSKYAGLALALGHKAYTFLLPEGYQCFQLNERSRVRLLQRFPPKFSEVEADHITHEYGVTVSNELPAMPDLVEIVGYASDDSLECLVVKIDGQAYRPDGNLYHVTLSRQPHRKSRESNDLLLNSDWHKTSSMFVSVEPQFRIIKKKSIK